MARDARRAKTFVNLTRRNSPDRTAIRHDACGATSVSPALRSDDNYERMIATQHAIHSQYVCLVDDTIES
jgi:hypothetical protein